MSQYATQPNQDQFEALSQIGNYLHQVREERLLSLEQVAAQTMIQARLLRAIETADFSQLPEPIYIRGFIRRYAEVLGLDGSDLAQRFPVEPDSRAIKPSWQKSGPQLRPTHLWIAYTLIIIAAIGGLHQYLTRFASSVDAPESGTDNLEAVQPAPETPTSSTPAPSSASDNPLPAVSNPPDETTPEPSNPDEPIRIEIRLTQASWLRVTVDGKQELEEVLPEGTQRTWTGKNEITIRAGNAGGVLLAQNNQEAELMGDPGAVREVTFTAEPEETNDSENTRVSNNAPSTPSRESE